MFSLIPALLLLFISHLHVRRCSAHLGAAGYLYAQPLKRLPVYSSLVGQENPSNQIAELASLNSLNLGALPHLDNFLPEVDSYIVDGRLLKQYSVMENQQDDQIPQDFFQNAPPLVLGGLEGLLSDISGLNPSFYPLQGRGVPRIQPITRSHGPVALGSGSLGYIRLPNGGVYLGSGSLGYINSQQRVDDANEARMRKGIPASPVTFGSAPSN